jgi:hypothetical protein
MTEVPGFDPLHDILMLITGMNTEKPLLEYPVFFKDKLNDVRMTEVKYFNCSETPDNVSAYNLDSDEFEWP